MTFIQIKIDEVGDKYKITKNIKGGNKKTDSIGCWTCDWKEVCKRVYEYLLTKSDTSKLIIEIAEKRIREKSMSLKFIEDYRDKYSNEEIWIIGCGPSLDSFPDDFFSKKITIALNWAIIAFPDSTYWCCPRAEMVAMMRFTNESVMAKGIFLFPFVPSQNWELTERESLQILGEFVDKSILMRWKRLDFSEELFKKNLQETIECIARNDKCLYLGLGILHCAIQAAVVMGAKRITLVGCEGEYTKYPFHAQKRGMSYFYIEPPNKKYSVRKTERLLKRGIIKENGTRALISALNPLGILVRKFYYDQGYRQIENKIKF